MEWLTDFINIYFLITFIAIARIFFKFFDINVKDKKKKGRIKSWLALGLASVIGIIFYVANWETDTPKLITTWAVSASLYQLALKWFLEKVKM